VFERGGAGPDAPARRPGIDLAELVAGYRRARPPLGVRIAFLVIVTVLLIGPLASLLSTAAGRSVLGGVPVPADVHPGVTAYGLLGMLLSCLLGVAVALEMRAGRRWARAVCVVIALVALAFTVVGLVGYVAPAASAGVLASSVDLLVVVQVLQTVLLTATPVLLLVPGSAAHFR
jgi:predicted membrane protein